MKRFFKNQWSNILFILLIVLLLIPQTRISIQVGVNRLISFGPSEISEEKREVLKDYTWDLQNLTGERINFQQAKGKVTLVNSWATWCPPCIAEMPSFQKLYEDYQDRVEFYFVSQEETAVLQKFVQKKAFILPVYQPLSNFPEQLQSNSLPVTYVLSKEGEIVVNKTGAADWNTSGFRDFLDNLLLE